jgi:chromosome segregation ATPase
VEGIKEDLLGYKSKWETLNMEIMRHEETIERQRRQLSLLNISLNDRDLRSDTNESREKSVKTAAELIAEEEAEIRQLEIELERLSAS